MVDPNYMGSTISGRVDQVPDPQILRFVARGMVSANGGFRRTLTLSCTGAGSTCRIPRQRRR